MDNLKNLISLREASKISGYHPDYISSLIRTGKIRGTKIGRNWFTTADEVEKYHVTKKFVAANKVVKGAVSPLKVLAALTFAALVILGLSMHYSSPMVIKADNGGSMVAAPVGAQGNSAKTVFFAE